MKFLGLHWKTDDGTPLQLLIENRKLHVWARSCPRGGEWTAWRRLDVDRNADGTLNETVANATNAKTADTATRLAKTISINLTGAVTGTGYLDGTQDVHIETSGGSGGDSGNVSGSIADLSNRIAGLEAKCASLNTDTLAKLENRQNNIIAQIRHFMPYIHPESNPWDWDPDKPYAGG